jgi:hypothetical protein
LIRHERWPPVTATPVFALAVAMVEPSFGTLLVPFVGAATLVSPRPFAAVPAAIAVPAITGCADEKHRLALLTKAHSLPENRCVPNRRHALSQARLDNGTRFVAG